MSATGALIIALITILALGAFAAWLMNVPLWMIGVVSLAGGWAISRVFKRFSRARARQDTERIP
jgi:uncharacterized membrane protein